MNPPRFKVKGFVAVQYRDDVFGNYRAGGEGVESRLLLCQLCSWWDERGWWFVVRQAHHEGEWGCKDNRRDCRLLRQDTNQADLGTLHPPLSLMVSLSNHEPRSGGVHPPTTTNFFID